MNCDESRRPDDDLSPLRKKRCKNQNDKPIEIHDSFWNCYEVATENMLKDEDVGKKSAIATNEIYFYVKNDLSIMSRLQ